ncbi:MAG TPA: aspartate dehydrogenase [Candidatus Thermoplasmatota archaeon]|nr:aspartate dehydrogenase [Candidatus Thermoplasmatota archaeon]
MRVLLVGCGALGSAIARGAVQMPGVKLAVFDADQAKARALAQEVGATRPDFLDWALAEAQLVIEAASQEALREIVPRAMGRGLPVIALSVGALADPALLATAMELGAKHGGKLLVPSGAVAGLDAVRAAREAGVEEVTLVTAKPPEGFGLSGLVEPKVLYEGPAREAVEAFPKNVNVAASLALAGVGFERTRVRIVADPSLRRNTHTIVVRGAFGTMECRVENEPSPSNPASSWLASLAALALLRRFVEPVQVGT